MGYRLEVDLDHIFKTTVKLQVGYVADKRPLLHKHVYKINAHNTLRNYAKYEYTQFISCNEKKKTELEKWKTRVKEYF